MINYYGIIKSPLLTEKASFLSEKFNKYALYVSVKANKSQLKKAIKLVFGVDVLSINVMRVPRKVKRFKGVLGCRKERKKVYFSLSDGQNLDIMSV